MALSFPFYSFVGSTTAESRLFSLVCLDLDCLDSFSLVWFVFGFVFLWFGWSSGVSCVSLDFGSLVLFVFGMGVGVG